jgi:hypothetical protein
MKFLFVRKLQANVSAFFKLVSLMIFHYFWLPVAFLTTDMPLSPSDTFAFILLECHAILFLVWWQTSDDAAYREAVLAEIGLNQEEIEAVGAIENENQEKAEKARTVWLRFNLQVATWRDLVDELYLGLSAVRF